MREVGSTTKSHGNNSEQGTPRPARRTKPSRFACHLDSEKAAKAFASTECAGIPKKLQVEIVNKLMDSDPQDTVESIMQELSAGSLAETQTDAATENFIAAFVPALDECW